ncbi:MAG: GNAT family acetyltransferase [Lachnospiraceae bacterium]|nr:GNAT family acetyltransferase [Lachnospiraceae bacterium]
MLTYDDALNMNYYKKAAFTGWMGGMRFVLKKVQPETPEGEDPKPPIFLASVWPGPYIFDKTPKEKITDETFSFDDEGRRAAVDWINEQYESRQAEWPKKKMDTDFL